ncbi:4096_t:CDS:2, partial [Racocetra fulgida]
KPLTLEIAKQIAYTRNGKCISEKYVNNSSPLLWKCENGHQFNLPLSNVKNQRNWCRECMKLGLEFAQNLANKKSKSEKLGIEYAKELACSRNGDFTIKEFVDPYFRTTPFEQWKLSSFIEMRSGPGFVKSDCLYFYKEELQNISKSLEFDDEQKTMALKLIENIKWTKRTDVSVSGHKVQKKQITTGYDFLTTDPNPKSSQRIKCNLNNEVDEEEYDMERTIVGT